MLICTILLILGLGYIIFDIISKPWNIMSGKGFLIYCVTRYGASVNSWSLETFGYEEDVDEIEAIEVAKFLENVERPVIYRKDKHNISIKSLDNSYSMYIEVKSL